MKLFTQRLLLFFLFTFCSFQNVGAVVANFTASTVAGCSPLVVNFHNTSTPIAGTTFSWNLGLGGMPITLTDASSSYIIPGTYTITLTATNGSSVSTHSVTVTVYPSPTVSFFASDTTVCPGSPVTFTNTSTSGVPGPMTCTWNFGDGFMGAGSSPSHTYTSPGFYSVTLSVTNADGCVSSLTKVAYMNIYTPATPNFTATTTYFCEPPAHAVFANLTTGFGPFSYVWRFGDGSPPATTASPVHDYLASGTYTVTLAVTDGHGCTDSLVAPSYITVANMNAAFTGPSVACVNTMVTFLNTSSIHLSSSWVFGDGHSSSSDTGFNVFNTAGTYNVTVVIFDGYCYDTVTHPITITPGPVASFTIAPVHPCPPPVSLSFAGTAPSGTTVSWLFGDGTSGSGLSPTHTYWRRGVDTIRMICVGPSGCIDTVTQIDTLYDMVHYATASVYSGCKPLTVNFGATMLTNEPDTTAPAHPYPFPATSYSWDFGDGSPTSPVMTPTHIYTAVGVFTAVLTTVTSNGCTIYDTVVIRVGAPPVVTFTATPVHQCFRDNFISITATVISGPVDSFVWAFTDGGGVSSGGPTSSYHFTHPGTFTGTLVAYYHGCPSAPFTLGTSFVIDSPMAAFADSVYCVPAKRVQFRDFSLGDDTHLWIFGDGATSTLDDPIHDYPFAIPYTVKLATYNITSGCRDTATVYLNLARPTPSFTALDTAICRDDIAVFTSTVTGGTAGAYWWHMSARSADSNSAGSIDTFHTVGRFTVTLVIQDQNGCFDTAVRPNYILVAKPVAHFSVSPPSGCLPFTTVFTDASTDVAGTFLTNFNWDFGDGGTASVTTPSVSHTFTTIGTYTTTEIVTDNVGCKDTLVQSLVTVYHPTASFSATNVHPCKIDSTHFINSSLGIVSSYWMFGDGFTSTLGSPWHQYTATGTYTVKLVVTDAHGCTDTLTRVNYIAVTQPTASFFMSDSVSICPPLMVMFTNTSVGALFYNWDLGGSSTSSAFAPSNLYTATGLDTVRLIASNAYGCRDTAYGHVSIFGYAGAFTYTPLTGCTPLTVHFNASTINVPNITWDFADGTTSAVSYVDTISHTYTIPGAYVPKLILNDNSGCQNSSIGIDTIKVNAIYPKMTTFPSPVCRGDTFKLIDSSYSYWSTIISKTWTFNGITTTVDSPEFFISGVGTYPAVLVLNDGWGCTATLAENVNIYDLPVITAGADTVVCVGDAATLTGYGGTSYTWAAPATLSCVNCNPTHASPVVVTTYTVTGKDAHGCTSTDTVTVSLRTHTISVARGDTQICVGTPVDLFDSGGTKYTWVPALGLDDPHDPTPVATPTATTTYMAIAQLAGCIPDTSYVTVIVHPLPTVDAGPDQYVVSGATAQLEATGRFIESYKWEDRSTLSCNTCSNPVASMSVTTTYNVTVLSDFGCRNSDSVTIHIFCDKSQVFVPNSFTPNTDGQNDVFYPRGTGVGMIKSFRVYNRWGQLMHERSNFDINDPKYGWDGSYEGDMPRPDVYVYIVEAVCETGEVIFIKGDVTIIR